MRLWMKGNTVLQFNLGGGGGGGGVQKTYTLSEVACPPGIAVTNHSKVFLSDEQERCVLEVEKVKNIASYGTGWTPRLYLLW